MDDIWRFGIPAHIRKIIWPFIVQNKLQLSKKLYEINLAKAKADIKEAEENMISAEIEKES
jgi:hypothetical protein